MSTPRPDRRQFATCAATLVVPGVVATATATSQDAPEQLGIRPGLSEADALVELLRARHGLRLSRAEALALRGNLERSLGSAARLARLPLTNGDEPAVVFTPDVP